MDLAQAFVSYAGWIFSVTWGTVLAAISMIAFGRDILPNAKRAAVKAAIKKDRP
jgi:hypothetical protein